MNFDSLNKWLMLAANMGVIVGIIFLSIEVSQNNELLRAEARANRIEARIRGYELFIENPDIREIETANSFPGMTIEEAIGLNLDAIYWISLEHQWQEVEAGLLDIENLGIEPRRPGFQDPRKRDRKNWEILKQRFHPEFVKWMDENIVDP